jgi:hypothetical protein
MSELDRAPKRTQVVLYYAVYGMMILGLAVAVAGYFLK